eukprot:3544209-Pyramimonas_sp.AAC.1
MAAFGKACYSTLLTPPPTALYHGCYRYRSREDVVMGASFTSWRLRSQGITHAMTLKGLPNAFGNSQWVKLDET